MELWQTNSFRMLHFLLFVLSTSYASVPYSISYYSNSVDHFGLVSKNGTVVTHDTSFIQRLIVIDTWCPKYQVLGEPDENGVQLDQRNHTIFLYTGGKGSIEDQFKKSGYLLDLAKHYGALVLFIEHRFYGESYPFGNSSLNFTHLPYLTVDQAVADYMNITYFYKFRWQMMDAEIVTFGSFYAGGLASYMRFKFPNQVAGALASGAPLKMADNFKSRTLFWDQVTSQYQNIPVIGPKVVDKVKNAFHQIDELRQYGPQGYQVISNHFNLCYQLTNKTYDQFLYTIRNVFGQLAINNNPYPVGDLPAYPVKFSANILFFDDQDIRGLVDLTNWFYKQSRLKCFDPTKVYHVCPDPAGCTMDNDGTAWSFQTCYELSEVIGSDQSNSMFPNLPWPPQKRNLHCSQRFDLPKNQRYQWFKINYWGSQVSSATNIIWTNGLLDPWYGTGIALDTTPYLKALGAMEGASQGLDLMSPMDGDGMEEYRKMELELIGQIIDGTFPSS
ncbi:dipeptidyl peptidase 2-like isoform X2 [Convolutriloba macropyga]|uniref:dipeptidyl peptidase 2-like isoform X2 n=1 Tax=Convolutriloba macropyga TaxID=536237 RepID=UPI003F5260C3